MGNGAVITRVSEKEVGDLAAGVLIKIDALLAANGIYPGAVQRQMLTSHVHAMALRSLSGEALPDIEADLFEDISEASLQLAQQIVDLFGNLPPEEAWLLSVHFEVAKSGA